MIELVISLFLFGMIHSWMATTSFKRYAMKWMGNVNFSRFYRLIYNALSALTFLPSLIFSMRSSAELWQLKGFWMFVLISAQVLAAFCILLSLKQIDWRDFLGIRQLKLPLNRTEQLESLVISGFYKYVRHPLYIFSMLLIWATPVMTLNWFAFCFGCSLYFVVGSYFEEIKLQRMYGTAYTEYKRSVFWFF